MHVDCHPSKVYFGLEIKNLGLSHVSEGSTKDAQGGDHLLFVDDRDAFLKVLYQSKSDFGLDVLSLEGA
jgi:hypothetical protein